MQSYQYYAEITSDEHMLYAREIAEKYKVNTTTGFYHSRFVTALLNDKIKSMETIYRVPIFYHTRYGLERVYSEKVYKQVMEELVLESKGKGVRSLSIKTNLGQKETSFKYIIANE